MKILVLGFSSVLWEWASEEMIVSMKVTNDYSTRWRNWCDAADMESMAQMNLSIRKEGDINIINLPEFWEFASTTSMKAHYKDMDRNGERNIAHLLEAPKFKGLADKVSWLSLMSLERIYKLMNIVAKGLNIQEIIDEDYINTVVIQVIKCWNSTLPKDHPLGRIGRAINVILSDWFVMPLSLRRGKLIVAFDCVDNYCWIYVSDDSEIFLAPLAEISKSISS